MLQKLIILLYCSVSRLQHSSLNVCCMIIFNNKNYNLTLFSFFIYFCWVNRDTADDLQGDGFRVIWEWNTPPPPPPITSSRAHPQIGPKINLYINMILVFVIRKPHGAEPCQSFHLLNKGVLIRTVSDLTPTVPPLLWSLH